MRRVTAALVAVGVLGAAYTTLDVLDVAPGLLTQAPLPTVVVPSPLPSGITATLPAPDPVGMPVRPADAGAPLPSAAGLQAALAAALADPALADASAVVRDGLTGATLLDIKGATPRVPASTTKLLSALAVARAFPGGAVFTTSVRAGATAGRVVLVAGGDTLLAPGAGSPTDVAGRAGLAELADRLVAALRARPGGLAAGAPLVIQVDGSYAAGPPTAPTWPASYRTSGIAGTVAPIGLATQRAAIGHPGPLDPVGDTARAFLDRLAERGVAATFDPAPAAPGGVGEELASVRSAPIAQLLALALQDSDNTLTESLARSGAVRAGRPGDFGAVGAFVRESVAAAGIDVSGVALHDASGLDPTDAVPARVLVDVLGLAVRGGDGSFATALGGLPVAGLTGTLDDRFAAPFGRPGVGWVRAKTGTLTEVNTLAGLVTTADGRLLVFAALQHGGAGTPTARAALDRFAATLATCGCR